MSTPNDYGVFSTGGAMRAMWEECQYTAPQGLIEWFATHATEEAGANLRHTATVMQGIGCLVSSDAEAAVGAGSFRDGDGVATLLFTFANQIEAMAELAEIGAEATWWQTRPEERAERARMLAKGNGHE